MLPFSREQFFELFAAYNSANWPAGILAYPLGALALLLAWPGNARGGRCVSIILALMWAWVGVVYHAVYFSQINPIADWFAVAFVAQGLLFALQAFRKQGLVFGPRSRLRSITGAMMIVYAMVIYPLIGLAVGERYPAMPLFGLAPCPLLIYTLGLMLWATFARWWLWIVPLLWSAIAGSAFILLSVPQDLALPVSGLVALLIMWLDRGGRPTAEP